MAEKRKVAHRSVSPPRKKAKKTGSVVTFHVKLEGSNAERVLSVGDHETFSLFAEGIITAFSYDTQRIYSFHLDGEPFSPAGPTYYSPVANKTPTTDETVLSAVPWTVGQSLLLLYDYALCHNFTITVQKVEETSEQVILLILEEKSKGIPPHQDETDAIEDEEFDVSDSEEDSSEEEIQDGDEGEYIP